MNAPKRFSLVEGLILLLAVGLLGSVLMPVFKQLSENAGLAKCRGNLYTLGAASHLYASENGGRLPENTKIPASIDGTFIGDGRMYGKLLAEENGGYGDVGYLGTAHSLFCPTVTSDAYQPGNQHPDQISEDNKLTRMGYVYIHRSDPGMGPVNDTIYGDPNLPLCFDFGYENFPGQVGEIISIPSHKEIMNVLYLGGHVRVVPLEQVNAILSIRSLYNDLREYSETH